VSLDAYQIDRYEVTNAQYLRFLQSSGGRPPRYWVGDNYPPGQAEYPVVGISWEQASAYCQWAGKRLPTEAEWERACRGTQGQSYPWGEAWDEKRANTGSFFVSQWPERLEDGWLLLVTCTGPAETLCPRPVGSYPEGVSEAGVFDLVGNVAEWVADWYNWGGYQDLPLHNPLGLGPPWNHAVRGSAWFDRRGQEELIANVSRCAKRNSSHSSDDPRLGFRCAW
jgi:formylglycine-generating enzyme required for sulfatase activity